MKIGLDARMVNFSGIGTTIRGLLENWTPEQLSQVTLLAPDTWKNPYGCQTLSAPEKVYGVRQHFSTCLTLMSPRFTAVAWW
jgi:hypothetical protein